MKRVILTMLLLCGVAVAQSNCTMETVRGTYAVSYLGWLTIEGLPAPIPGVIFGVASIDWNGAISGVASVGGLGPVTDYLVTGTAKVNPDCTGALTLSVQPKDKSTPPETEVDRIIVFPQDKEIRVVVSNLGAGVYPALLGTWKRMSPVPNAASW
jgi:hypothetical protein